MSAQPTRSASQLRDFIDTNHVYTDDLDEEIIERIREAAEREPEEFVPSGVTKRKGKARRSLVPRFPPEWANSKEAFQKALKKFEYTTYSATPERSFTIPKINLISPTHTEYERQRDMPTIRSSPNVDNNKASSPPRDGMFSIVPREVMSLFNGFEQLEEHNWNTWKGHMKDNLEMCDLWEIVIGNEKKPLGAYGSEAKTWSYREKVARVVIKNSLGTVDYKQVQSAKTAAEVWEILNSLHQPTGAQGTVDMIWKFWSKRCGEGESVRQHIGDVRAIHSDLAEMGYVIDDYLVAIAMSKSLPVSYDTYVSTIFAGIQDLEQTNSRYVASKIFEEEARRDSKSEDANMASTRIFCSNCKKPGHMKENCYSKGGGKEGQGPRQIAKRKKQEAEQKKIQGKQDQYVQATDEDAFYTSHVALDEKSATESIYFTSYSLSHDSWIADSGASAHIANRREMFDTFTSCKKTLNVAGGLTATIEGTGTVNMRGLVNGRSKDFKLMDVLYVPTTSFCLISGSKLDKLGGKVEFENSRCSFRNKNGDVIATGVLDGNLYRMNTKAIVKNLVVANVATTSVLSWHEAHRRLGHISLSSLKILFKKNNVTGIKLDQAESIPQTLNCESCIAAKAHRAPFQIKTHRRAQNFGDLTHSDVWGSPNVKHTPGGNQYFILFIDDCTRFITVKLMKHKASVKQKMMNYCNFVHTQYGRWPKEIRADNAAEYEGTKGWFEERGIEFKPSAPHSPQQNGVSERMNRTLLEIARAMMIEKSLPECLWGEAVLHASWVRNRSPTVALLGKTPIEALTNINPNFAMAQEFGKEVYVLEELPKPKTQPKARKVLFTGFEEGPKAIRYYDPNTLKIKVSRNYYFQPTKAVLSNGGSDDIQTQKDKSDHFEGESVVQKKGNLESTNGVKSLEDASRNLRTKTATGESTRKNYVDLAGFNPRQYIRSSKVENLNHLTSEGHLKGDFYPNSRHFADIAFALMAKNCDDELPNTIQEARNHSDARQWDGAIQSELDTLIKKKTWNLVDPPKGRNIIGNRWVFTKKFDANGKLSKYKARLVAQGHTQGYIYDYSDTFSPVVRFDSFRLVLAIVAYHGLEIGQMDIKGAYLNGTLSEEIYMRQPKGCEDGTGRVCHLLHTLYGLKQSGREWNKTLKHFLVETAGYTQLIKEHGIFYRSDTKGYDIITVWVDDFLIASTNKERLNKAKQEIGQKWESVDLGEPRMLLGVQLERDPVTKSIRIHQEQYILKILRKFGMEDCTPAYTPLPPGATYPKADEDEIFEDSTRYRAAIGSLMFASVASRPDITYSTNLLAQFNGAPTQKHWNAVKHIFRYLKSTMSTGILYCKERHSEPKFTLTAYSDADNGKGYDRRSISGSVITIAGGAIKWSAEKQRLITVSTAESEYVAANLTGRNSLFLRDVMEELEFKHDEPIPLFMDSDGAIALTKNPGNMRATLHIDKIYHWIRQHVEEGIFSPESIPGKENPADIFTKSLDKSSFQRHKINIGII